MARIFRSYTCLKAICVRVKFDLLVLGLLRGVVIVALAEVILAIVPAGWLAILQEQLKIAASLPTYILTAHLGLLPHHAAMKGCHDVLRTVDKPSHKTEFFEPGLSRCLTITCTCTNSRHKYFVYV